MTPIARSPRHSRTFASPAEALGDVAAVLRRTGRLADVYLRGRLEPELRERVMVAVSRVNACRGCTRVHERWGIRAGVTSDELEAIGLGDLAALDDRDRAAIIYATALAEARFRRPIPAHVASSAAAQLTASELAAVDAVARAMALANLSVNTTEALIECLRARRPTLGQALREETPTKGVAQQLETSTAWAAAQPAQDGGDTPEFQGG